MRTKQPKLPRLRRHQTVREKSQNLPGRAFCEVSGRRFYFGAWDSQQATSAYHTFCAEYAAAGFRIIVPPEETTIAELCAAYWQFAEAYYKPSGEHHMILDAIKALESHYGDQHVTDFGPLKLKAVREHFVHERFLTRTGVNHRIDRIKRMFKWGVAEEMVPVTTYQALQAVAGLRKGRSAARESKPVLPPPMEDVLAVLRQPELTRPVRAIITLQLYSGARAGEIVVLRAGNIDTTGTVWEARLDDHKTAHHGRERVLFFGPECQDVLRPLLLRPADAYLFSPIESEMERRAHMTANRKTPISCGNRPGTNRKAAPSVEIGEVYTVHSYRRALAYACKRAGVNAFSPHKLRHLAATNIRAKFGLEAASTMLGHAGMKITEVYAEKDYNLARRVAAEMG